MLLAELVIRHTRRHMPTRRVAPGSAYLPMSGANAPGSLLIGAVVHEFGVALDDDDRDDLAQLIRLAATGLDVPRIAVRHRLQRDTHGLDRSRHRVEQFGDRLVVELDTHGSPLPQLLGLVLAVSGLPQSARHTGLLVARQVLDGRNPFQRSGVFIRRLAEGVPYDIPWAPGATWRPGAPAAEVAWEGIDSERRWAMEVLGIRAGTMLAKDDVNRRFRRLLRDAHPDTGAAGPGAAERIEELSDARELLLDVIDDDIDNGLDDTDDTDDIADARAATDASATA
jgi:hypothetical protein